jgi:hypothetical protein
MIKMINDLKEDSNKQMNEVKKLIQDLDRKSAIWMRNSAKKTEKTPEILEMKNLTNQNKNLIESSLID